MLWLLSTNAGFKRRSVADISMCAGAGCPKKLECYRHTAPANSHWQSYFSPPRKADGSCKYFWPVITREELVQEEEA
jgi:hypothetical protein